MKDMTNYNGVALEVFERGPVRLILGDAKLLAQEFKGQADMILSDPPYDLTSGGRGKDGPTAKGKTHRTMGGMFSHKTYDNSGKLMKAPSWDEIAEVMRTLSAKDCDAYIMSNDKNVFAAHAALLRQKWKFHNLLPWDKGFATPNRWYMKHVEFTLYMWRGHAKKINNPGSKQIFRSAPPRGDEKRHPTQKPEDLLTHYIENSSMPGDLVVDPYAGSGSTLLAAAACGRRALGFEIDETFFELTCKALRDRIPA